MYCFTKVFLFHKPNIRGNSWILTNSHQPHPHYRVKLNNCFRFQWHFWRCKFSPFFSILYIVTSYTFVATFLIHGLACTGTTLNMNLRTKKSCCLQLLVFLLPKSHWQLLQFGTSGRRFFQRAAVIKNSTQAAKKCRNKSY